LGCRHPSFDAHPYLTRISKAAPLSHASPFARIMERGGRGAPGPRSAFAHRTIIAAEQAKSWGRDGRNSALHSGPRASPHGPRYISVVWTRWTRPFRRCVATMNRSAFVARPSCRCLSGILRDYWRRMSSNIIRRADVTRDRRGFGQLVKELSSDCPHGNVNELRFSRRLILGGALRWRQHLAWPMACSRRRRRQRRRVRSRADNSAERLATPGEGQALMRRHGWRDHRRIGPESRLFYRRPMVVGGERCRRGHPRALDPISSPTFIERPSVAETCRSRPDHTWNEDSSR